MTPRAIEFFGGPLDGHAERLATSSQRLPARMRIPVKPSLLAFIFGNGPKDHVRSVATSTAHYRLRRDGGRLRYQHVRSVVEAERECSGA